MGGGEIFILLFFSRKELLQHVFCTDVNDPVEKEKLMVQKRKRIITGAESLNMLRVDGMLGKNRNILNS